MTTPDVRVRELLAEVGRHDTCVADLLCDRHPADSVAFTIIEPDLSSYDLTYGELRDRSERFAAALADLGVEPGDRVATLMGKSADLVTAILGIWRRGAVHVPLFTAFAPSAIDLRLTASAAKVVVVDAAQRPKLDELTGSWRIVTAGGPGRDGDLNFATLLTTYQPGAAAVAVGGDAPLIRLFTSGTTGEPKGVVIPVRAIAAFQAYLEFGFDLRPDDVLWNAADPGWAYGLYYAITGPLAAGHRGILLHAPFSAELTWKVLSKFRVTNFAAAPTVYRALRNDPTPVPQDLVLRCCSSAGEPLNPDVVAWAERTLGVPVRDHYGQTELGMAIINGHHPAIRRSLKPGSMGHPMPGWWAEVLDPERDEIAPPGTRGRVAIDLTRSPLMWFSEYADAPEKTKERFSPDGRWYLTGDAGLKDEEGHFFFSSRDDDVIIMAGYRIGPFEVESVLMEHPAVAEAAVVGVPDELRGEVVEAFVVLQPGVTGDERLVTELQQHVKRRYAAHAYPRAVHFVPELPKTPSGKIQRFVLRQRRREELAAPTA
ncbi:AMP-dependent synthetase [Carbonactinospora thermoautotrophica]|uniref:AMP-binding protein n=1 Tax=Carbonactinospora thermoautotrophica TaxID=1469144 RepID=UPI0022708287|nr:AMP-binding protein [Carbonactinospora thermoautotrophica]MCX9190472.1 AMP-dependent synthetase [Carbonactinospora thermoautotrophica]